MIAADESEELTVAHYWHLAYVPFVHKGEHITDLHVRRNPTQPCQRDHRLANGGVRPVCTWDILHLMHSDQAEQLTIRGHQKTPRRSLTRCAARFSS